MKNMLNLTNLQKERLVLEGVTVESLEVLWTLFPSLTFQSALEKLKEVSRGEIQVIDPSDDFKSARFTSE